MLIIPFGNGSGNGGLTAQCKSLCTYCLRNEGDPLIPTIVRNGKSCSKGRSFHAGAVTSSLRCRLLCSTACYFLITRVESMKRSTWFILLLLFYVSGASGLVYEIIWVRMFSLVFGNTNYAATTVLSAFFAGIAAGSLFFGKKSDAIRQPLRMYGILELAIGIAAMAVPVLISMADTLYPYLYRHLGESSALFFVVRFLLSFVIVFIPTFFMGGSLPLIIRLTSLLKEGFGKSVSLLYAFNTFGGVTGSFVSGFLLIRYMGIHSAVLAGAVLNVMVGIAALGASRWLHCAPSAPGLVQEADLHGSENRQTYFSPRRLLFCIAFLTGLLSLSFEVVWARLLVYVLSSSVYAFNIMLTTFLFGIALGSLTARKLIVRSTHAGRQCGGFLWCTGIYGVLTIPLMVLLAGRDEAIMSFFGLQTWFAYNVGRFVESAIVLLIPTFLMGIVFPFVASLAKPEDASGSSVIGNVYFVNTVGGIAGAFIGGFILIPLFGCKWSILVLSACYLVAGAVMVARYSSGYMTRMGAVLMSAAVMVAAVFSLQGNPFAPLFNIREKGSEITYIREGVSGTVTVHQHPSFKVINVNRVNVAGTSFVLRTTQKLQGLVPLLVRKDPRLVCQIGFGSGETSSIVVRYEGVERLDVVDISGEVFAAAPEFHDINGGVYRSEKFKPIVMDGKNYMHLTDQKYDLIMNDSIHPVECGNASLYTKEYFEDCKRRLRDGGVMSSWFPLFALDQEDFKSLIHTFNTVFPGCTLWVGNNCVNRHALLIGRKDGKDVEIDFDFVQKALQREWIRKEFADIRMYTVYDVIDSFMLNGDAISALTRDAYVNTDLHPVLEYRSPTTLESDPVLLARNISSMAAIRSNVYDNLVNIRAEDEALVRERLDIFMKSTDYVYRGHVSDILSQYGSVVSNYQKASEVNEYDLDGKKLIEEMQSQGNILTAKLEKGSAPISELLELSIINLKLGRLGESSRSLELALKQDPHNRSLLYSLFGIYQELDDVGNQARIIDLLVEVDENPDVLFQKGLLLGRAGRYEESAQFMERAVRSYDGSAKYHFFLGLSLQSLANETGIGDKRLSYYKKAFNSYERARELDVNKEFPVDDYLMSLKQQMGIVE